MPAVATAYSPGLVFLGIALCLSSFLIIHKLLKRPVIELMKGEEGSEKVNWLERRLRLERL